MNITNIPNNKRPEALYIHTPFCEHICYYCDYTRILLSGQNVDLYLTALENELTSYQVGNVSTIYIGGGTPSALDEVAFKRLFQMVDPYRKGVKEFTVEVNVENLTENKLLIMKNHGVNRLSIGVQSLHDETLKKAGRYHTAGEAIKMINLAKSLGFNNISVDLIYGLPNQTLEELSEDIDLYLALDLPHIATYALSVAPHTMFKNLLVEEVSDEMSRMMFDLILNKLRAHGYRRYEVSTFAKQGYECQHNLTYWNDEEYYGIGLGAGGYVNGVRYLNTKNLSSYNKGNYRLEVDEVNPSSRIEYFLLTNLRKADGFSLLKFKEVTNLDFSELFAKPLVNLVKYGLIEISNDRVFCSDEGLMKLDYVLFSLIKDL